VSLAAGADARRALTDGASELRRLLESVGRPDSRILIRDLPNGGLAHVAPNAPSMRTDVSTDLAGGSWSGAGRPGGEPEPDREQTRHHPGSSTATDGIPSATLKSRPTTTASRGHVGLDVSM
jgi:flagellar hook-length control protein FliK